MAEFRVMRWYSSMDGAWSPEASQRFRDQGFDGLAIVPSRDWIPQNFDFLEELEGLRSFSFTGKLRDDLSAFRIESLEDLTLVTGSKLAVPAAIHSRLRRLVLTDRPGLIVKSRWPGLLALRVGEWKASDLQMLDAADKVTHVYLEARRQRGALDGVEACASLESLIIINYSVANAEPLRGLDSLSELKLLAAKPTPPHETIDLSMLTSPQLAKIWISNAGRLLKLDSLAHLSSMRELRLIGCRLSDADMRAISALPKRIDVQIVKG